MCKVSKWLVFKKWASRLIQNQTGKPPCGTPCVYLFQGFFVITCSVYRFKWILYLFIYFVCMVLYMTSSRLVHLKLLPVLVDLWWCKRLMCCSAAHPDTRVPTQSSTMVAYWRAPSLRSCLRRGYPGARTHRHPKRGRRCCHSTLSTRGLRYNECEVSTVPTVPVQQK